MKFSSNTSPKSANQAFTLVEIMMVIGIMAMIVAIAVPAWLRARSQSRMKSCQENLSKIDGAKEQWAIENKKLPGTTPQVSDLIVGPSTSGYMQYFPVEPSGGTYTINPVGQDPVCSTSYPGHSLLEVGQAITELEF
ncbi:prepilin-type N-terminal cleavage/methylation domain-containing protein [Candidatus Sumerlaeota bacterium]|nr:prepilin-type N-terminal cleavage/methylation domain-containing protein [Candidatus Sumerlaeota bacterium]